MNFKKKATWELKNMRKALSSSVAQFLNDKEDEERLKKVKEELKKRNN